MKQIITIGTLISVLMLAIAAALAQQSSPRLIPFQGRLTDQQGRAYSNGQYTLTFTLYSQAVGGTALNGWVERHRKVGVINGMVNVFLGSIRSLDPIDFSQVVHLGITIDADDNPVTADPEMVPRQMIIPAFWAKNSDKLAEQNWTPIFGINSPLGPIPASKIQPQGITAAQISPGTIGTAQIGAGGVQTVNIGDGQITVEKLSPLFALDTVIPPGTIQAFGGTTIPPGWLLCDGSPASSGKYPRLYSAISTNWGAGNSGVPGATNDFNLPDLQGYFLRGVSGTTTNDPDRDDRTADHPGGNSGNTVGSVQGHKLEVHSHQWGSTTTGTDFTRILRSWTSSSSSAVLTTILDAFDAGLVDNASGQDDSFRVTPASAVSLFTRATSTIGQSGETRPMNAYVHYIIKY